MLSANVVAYELGVSDQRVCRLCNAGLVPGAIRRRAAWAIPAEALPLIRDLLEQPVVRQPKPKPAPALAKSEPAPVGMMTPPEAAAALGVTAGYVCQLAARGLAPGARKAYHPKHRHSTWLFPSDAVAFMRRYLGAKPAERATMRTQDNGEMPVLRIAEPGPEATALAEQVWAWHRAGRP